MVEGLCRGLLRDAAEAEDALQQTFLLAFRAMLGGVEPREPSAWLATIARNECLARIRERMRRPTPVAHADDRGALPDSLAEAIRRADLAALWQAISALPAQQRAALLMREFGGLSYDELALALGVSEPAVESLLFRARRSLRSALQPVCGASAAWDALVRLFAAAGPAAAVKVGAATVGVAVVAGGAVAVAPSSHRPFRTLPAHHPTVAPALAPVAPEPAPVVVAAARRPAAPAVVRAAAPAPAARPAEREERASERPERESEQRAAGDAQAPISRPVSAEDGGGVTAPERDGSGDDGSGDSLATAEVAVTEQPGGPDAGATDSPDEGDDR